jgi:AraC-like DNA-binding protein
MILEESIKLINNFPNPTLTRFDRDQWIRDHGQSNVIINCNSKEIYFPDHWTPLSLKCAFNGKEFYQSGNAIQCASDDNFLIFNKGKEYSSFIKSDTEVESFTINFSDHFVKIVINSIFSKPEKKLDDPFTEITKEEVYFFERSYTYNTCFRHQILSIRSLAKRFRQNKEQINELLAGLLETLISSQENIDLEIGKLHAIKKSTRVELYKRLHLAKDLIDSSYQTNLTLDTLSSVALLNPYYLLRLFKSYYKITPHQYLIQRRIEEAKKLLAEGNLSVSQVCNLVGFADISSFSKLFKKETGFSPSLFTSDESEK